LIRYFAIKVSHHDTRDGQVQTALFHDINGFCNPRRCRSALAGKNPVAFERKAAFRELLQICKNPLPVAFAGVFYMALFAYDVAVYPRASVRQ
jgi:hypothetical protein